jgi:hypothetical protein
MISVDLQDVNEVPIKRIAADLGIPSIGSKDDLIAAIKNRVSPTTSLILIPHSWSSGYTSGSGKGWQITSAVLSFFAVAGALVTAILTYSIAEANVQSAKANVESAQANVKSAEVSSKLYETELIKMREAADKEIALYKQKEKEAWMRVVVHKIIQEGMKTQWTGLTFDEIRTKFTTEAVAVKAVTLTKDDFSDMAIRKVLFELQEVLSVGMTYEDRYVTPMLAIHPKEYLTRQVSNLQVLYAILYILSKEAEGGKYTKDQMVQIVMEQVKNTTPVDVNAVLAELAALNYIIVDESGKLWSKANPPKKKIP